jgi:uncharacterized SAM-binding protein YcdF (DUF218 family)
VGHRRSRIVHELLDVNLNDLFTLLGIQSWKPLLTALVLPPVPWLLVMLVGARMMYWRRSVAWLTLLLGAAGVWFSGTVAVGEWLQHAVLKPPAPMSGERIADVKRAIASGKKAAVVVLGGGRETLAPEYGLSNLNRRSHSRLHYGVWLSRQTGAPILYSGGVGLAESVGVSEAESAARIAERDYGRPLTWIESESRDTRENAARSVAMLKPAGVSEIILVTHGWHMRRAVRAFESESQRAGASLRITPAPMGLAASSERPALRWLPSSEGFELVRMALREAAGLLLGA